jgi:hypothetical protein
MARHLHLPHRRRERSGRSALVRSLELGDRLSVSQIKTEPSALLALLLKHGLVADEAASFIHFRDVGWAALEPAIVASSAFGEFLTPDLVQEVVADLLDSPRVPHRVRRKVVAQLDQFIPEDDGPALAAAARYALSQQLPLPLDQVRRIAATNQTQPKLTLELLQRISPAPPPDKIVDTLAQLGEPYSNLATRAKDSFDVPDDAAHRAVFESLKKLVCWPSSRSGGSEPSAPQSSRSRRALARWPAGAGPRKSARTTKKARAVHRQQGSLLCRGLALRFFRFRGILGP